MEIPSGSTTSKYTFVGRDNVTGEARADFSTAGFTAKGALNGAAQSAFATTTVVSNGGGFYTLTVNEQTTLGSGVTTAPLALEITHSGLQMAPVLDVLIVSSLLTTNNQPRQNAPPTYPLMASTRNDGTHSATKPVRLRAGTVNDIAVGIDVSPIFGDNNPVVTVGTPVVSSGTLTATAAGPRDEPGKQYAIVTLGGSILAYDSITVDVPVTMRTGEQDSFRFTVEGMAD